MADYISSPQDGVIRRWDMKFIPRSPGEENWDAYAAYAANGGVLDSYEEVMSQTLEQQVVAAVQKRLDDFAASRGYGDPGGGNAMMSLCTYATSNVPKFRREAQYGVDSRDAHWATCYQIMADVLSGARPMPTLEVVMAEMPILQWPEV